MYTSVSSDTIVNIPFTSAGEVSAAVHENVNTLTLGNGVNVTSNGLESNGGYNDLSYKGIYLNTDTTYKHFEMSANIKLSTSWDTTGQTHTIFNSPIFFTQDPSSRYAALSLIRISETVVKFR